MKSILKSMIVVLALACGLFGVNSIRVAKDEVVKASHDLLPSGFRQAVAEKDLDDCEIALSRSAADVDLNLMPRYSVLLPGMTFADLQQTDLRPFKTMQANLKAGSGKLEVRLCCVFGSEAHELQRMKGKLDHLACRAAEDLVYLEKLQAGFSELAEVRNSLRQVTVTDGVEKSTDTSADSLHVVRKYIAERKTKSVAAKYRSQLKNGSQEFTSSELADVRQMLSTLEVAGN